ncbi:MAG: hypothetical protein ACLFPW_11355, partial [Spirochaetaceae bacterium]
VEAAEELEELGELEEAEAVEEAEAAEEPEELGALEEAEAPEEPEVVGEIVLEEDIISLEREESEEEEPQEELEEVEERGSQAELESLDVETEMFGDVHAPEAPLTTPLERQEEELAETAQAVPFEVGKPETFGEMTPLEATEESESAPQEEQAEEDLEEVGGVGEEESEELEEIAELPEDVSEELEEPTEVEEAEQVQEVEELGALEEAGEMEEILPTEEELELETPELLPEEEVEEVAEYLEEPEEPGELEEAEVEPAQHRPGSIFFSGFSFGERFSAAAASSMPSPGMPKAEQPERKPEVETIRGLEYVRIEPGTPSNAYELMGYEDLLEVLFSQTTIIREEEGLAEIESAAYTHAQDRAALDRRFRGLVNDVLHKYSDSVGVSQLFGGIDALFVDEEEDGEGAVQEEAAGPSPMGARKIHDAFTRRGFDLDRFLRRRGDTTGRLYRTLIELTRTWRARTCALLQHAEGGFRAGVTLGLEDPWREALNLDDESNLAREVLLRRMVLQTRLPLNRFVDFATIIRQGEVSGVQQTFFIPARYNDTDAYLMVGYDIQIPSIENLVTRFINAAGNR